MDAKALAGVDVVINLAGAGIADKRWTAQRKKELLDSRLDSLSTLSVLLSVLQIKPALFIGASAVGYYGDRGEERLSESSSPGTGFLSEVTTKWEASTARVAEQHKRSVILRIGIVLSKNGGALKEILKPAALGSYGYFGDGSAYYAWIHIDDICKIIQTQIEDSSYAGTYNATAPEPVTIKSLVKAAKEAKGGWGLLMPVPVMGLKLVLGEMTHMLTDSMRAVPERLMNEGYAFEHSDPVAAIKDILDRGV